jgi:hypothetical protein
MREPEGDNGNLLSTGVPEVQRPERKGAKGSRQGEDESGDYWETTDDKAYDGIY